jgi:AI-2 transport protein TqsA
MRGRWLAATLPVWVTIEHGRARSSRRLSQAASSGSLAWRQHVKSGVLLLVAAVSLYVLLPTELLALVPFTPGGLGFVAAGLVGTLKLAGIPGLQALTATLLYRLVAYWLPIPAGGVAYLLFRRRYHAGDQPGADGEPGQRLARPVRQPLVVGGGRAVAGAAAAGAPDDATAPHTGGLTMPAAGHEPTSPTGEEPARPGSPPARTADRPMPTAEAPTGASRSLAADGAWPLPRAVLVLLGGAGAVVVAAGLRSAAGIVGPAFLALTIAITIHPLLAWLQRRRVPGWLAVALTMLVTYAALLATAAALVLAAAQLATLLPGYQPQFTRLLDQTTGWLGELGVTQQQLDTAVSQFDLNSLARVLQQVLIGVAGVASDLGFILVLLFFLIIDSSTFPQRLVAAATQRPQLVGALTGFARATRQYIVVSTVFGLLVALVDVAALYWLDVPLPWLWGLLAFITNYVPNIGFVLGLLPPALLALLQGGVGRRCW